MDDRTWQGNREYDFITFLEYVRRVVTGARTEEHQILIKLFGQQAIEDVFEGKINYPDKQWVERIKSGNTDKSATDDNFTMPF